MCSQYNDAIFPVSLKPLSPGPAEVVLEPYKYLNHILGEIILTKMLPVFNHWLSIPKEKLDVISDIVQMMNTANVMLDDIEDNSTVRMGSPATHCMFGVGQSINTASYVYFLALEKLITLGKTKETTKVFTENVLRALEGQGIDIYWRDSFTCPTEDEYKTMAMKTGGVFGFIVDLMQVFSQNKSNFKPLVDILGIYFQILNDYENFTSENFNTSVSYCEDITEGKFSFLMVHAIRADLSDTQVMNILKLRTSDIAVKRYCVEYMTRVGSFEYTRTVLCQLESGIQKEIEKLGGNRLLTDTITEFGKFYRSH